MFVFETCFETTSRDGEDPNVSLSVMEASSGVLDKAK